MALPTSKITVTGSLKSFGFYVIAFVQSFMIFYSFGLKWFGLPFALLLAFGLWFIQNKSNPGAIRYYFRYTVTPNNLDGNLPKRSEE